MSEILVNFIFNFCTFSESKAGDKISWMRFREEHALTTHCTATKYGTGSRCLVFPWNLLVSSQTSCVKPVRSEISCGSVSCAAYKYGLITLQWSWWDRCYSCIPPPCWSTYWWFTDCLHSFIHLCYDHSQLDPFANPSLVVYIAETLWHVESMLFTLCFFRDCTQANK